jgi:hypothetical protein
MHPVTAQLDSRHAAVSTKSALQRILIMYRPMMRWVQQFAADTL